MADCLWSVLVLADRYGVDLGAVFGRTMDELEAAIQRRLDGPGIGPPQQS